VALLVAVAAALLAVTFASTARSGAAAPAFTSVSGSGKVTFFDFPEAGVDTTEQFEIAAHDGPHGPTGSIVIHSPLYSTVVGHVDVTCISVSGNDAVVGGTFRAPFTFLGTTISHFSIAIHDNGPPAAGGEPDEIHPVEFVAKPRPPGFSPCNLPPNVLRLLFPLDSGNFVVSARA
jgi:hypothetical protein